jgi:hypothetical protein
MRRLLNILLDGMGLGAHERVDKFGCANRHTHAFQARYSDDGKLWFSKILFIEFMETLERGVLVDVLEHKFASSLSGDTEDVNFDFGHVETLRVLSKPLAHLNQHLEGCLESGIDVQIVGETNPASTRPPADRQLCQLCRSRLALDTDVRSEPFQKRRFCLLNEQRHWPLQNQTRGSRLGSLY